MLHFLNHISTGERADSYDIHTTDIEKSFASFITRKNDKLDLGPLNYKNESAQTKTIEQQRILSTLLSNLPGMAYRYKNSSNWMLEFISDGCLELTGYPPAEWLERKVEYGSIIHPEDQDLVFNSIEKALSQQKPFQISYRIIKVSGEHKWVWEKGCGVYQSDGTLTAVEGFVTDVSERRQAEDALKAILQGTSAVTGEQFLHTLVKQLALTFGVQYVLIGQVNPVNKETVKTIVVWAKGSIAPNFEYNLEGTPCADVLTTSICHFPNGIQKLFPQDLLLGELGVESYIGVPIIDPYSNRIGVLALLHDKPLNESNYISSILTVFGSRIGAELERLKVEEELHISEKKIAEISNAMPGVVYQFHTDKAGTQSITYISDTIKELAGISPQQLYSNVDLIFEMVHPEDVALFRQSIQDSAFTLQPWLLDFRVYHQAKKTYRWIRGNSIPQRLPDGSLVWNGNLTDITDTKNAHEQLLENEERIRKIIDTALDAVIEMDAAGIITNWNAQAENIFGWEKEEAIGQSLAEIIVPCSLRKKHSNGISYFINTDEEKLLNKRFETLATHRAGHEFAVEVAVTSVASKGILSYSAFIHDISKRNQAAAALVTKNDELKKTNAELDRFIYSISHDLRAPLTSILGLVNIIGDEANVDTIREYLKLVENRILKLDDTVKSILDYSRNSRTESNDERIHFKPLIDELFTSMQYINGENRIDKRISVDESSSCFADKSRLVIILNNLLSNAIKYQNPLEENPFIAITIQVLPERLHIVVADNGIGIPEKHMPRIYDMFYRATSLSTGTGLGLYIVKEIVAKLQGTIEVISEMNKGTTFIISLPNHVQGVDSFFHT